MLDYEGIRGEINRLNEELDWHANSAIDTNETRSRVAWLNAEIAKWEFRLDIALERE
jgi:hypothetical protein